MIRRTCAGAGHRPKPGSYTEVTTGGRPRVRGICTVCGGTYQIIQAGLIRVHREPGDVW